MILSLFVRTGYTKFAGYLIDGMKSWDAAGFPIERIGQMSVHELNEKKSSLQIVDVRGPGEWKKGHVPGARHISFRNCANASASWITTSRRLCIAGAVIARALRPVF